MSVELVDELPRPKRVTSRSSFLTTFTATLRENPGRWAKYPTAFKTKWSAANTASIIRTGKSKGFPAGQFDAQARDDVVYVRYIGGAE